MKQVLNEYDEGHIESVASMSRLPEESVRTCLEASLTLSLLNMCMGGEIRNMLGVFKLVEGRLTLVEESALVQSIKKGEITAESFLLKVVYGTTR
jgi:hypothetical protein